MAPPREPGLGQKAGGVLVCFAAVFTLVAALLAYQGLVGGHVRVTQGPKRGPPTHLWTFTGSEAARVGLGSLALALAGATMLLNAFLMGRTRRLWRLRVGLALSLFALATLLYFPPWRLTGTGVVAAFYGFLVPALAGVAGRTGARVGWGVVGGAVLSGLLGGRSWLDGAMPGLLAFGFLGTHLAFLIHPPFREELTGRVLSGG